MDASLTGDLEKLTLQQSSSEAPSSQPVVPAEIIQHILSFLNPSDALTLPTLLACQLVSRYFAASSLDASVWRPLVEARWKHEAFEKPMKQLPLEEDQKLIDELFPTAESNLAATFRARFLLDSLVQRHIKKLVLGVKDRLISIDTIVALGKQVWDALYREEEIDGADESIHYSNVGWRKTTLNVSRRAEATKLWMRIASGELAGDEAVELGIFALNDFSPSGFPGQLEKLFCKCVESCTRVLAIGSDIKELRYRDPSTALESVTRLIWAQIDKLGMSNTRIELEAFGEGKNIDSTALDHRFLDAAFCCSINVRSARTSDSPSNVVNVSQLVYQALFIFIARRLPPPFTIRVKFPGLDHVRQIEWKQDPWATRTVCLATRSVAPPMLETGLRYHAEDFEGHTAVTVLTAFATDVSKAAEEDARPGQIVPLQAGRYAYLLLFACLHTFHDRILLPQLAEHLLSLYSKPAHALDVGIFEHLLLPHFPSSVVKQGQELVGKIRNQDSTVPAPQPRSRGCPLRLHVGDTFLHRRTGELGVVVGWELKPGKTTLVTPRSKRGAQGGAIPKPTPLRLAPQLDEYLYLAVMESATRYSSPTKVNPLDVDIASSPTSQQVDRLIGHPLKGLGRLFAMVETLGDGGIHLVPSAELEARYPDG